MRRRSKPCLTATKLIASKLGFAAAALALGSLAAPAPVEAQIHALLPTIDEMEQLEPLPIEGVWQIREIGKRIVIEGGHAYAEDSWVHMLLFRIEPDQVVITNIRELPNGDFIGRDLPLMCGSRCPFSALMRTMPRRCAALSAWAAFLCACRWSISRARVRPRAKFC